jgi:hypothetical protein
MLGLNTKGAKILQRTSSLRLCVQFSLRLCVKPSLLIKVSQIHVKHHPRS